MEIEKNITMSHITNRFLYLMAMQVHVHAPPDILSVSPNPCSSNPCKNGATCNKMTDTEYTCSCRDGFYGPNCEKSKFVHIYVS